MNSTIFLTLNFQEQESDKFMQRFIQQGGCNNRTLDFPSNCLEGNPSLSHHTHSPLNHTHTTPRVTLKFVNSGDNSKNLHLKLDFWLDLFLSTQLLLLLGAPPDPEQHGGGGEAVGTHRVAVGVLGAEIQLQPLGRVGVDLSARGAQPLSASHPSALHSCASSTPAAVLLTQPQGIIAAPPTPAAHHRGGLPSWVSGRNK